MTTMAARAEFARKRSPKDDQRIAELVSYAEETIGRTADQIGSGPIWRR